MVFDLLIDLETRNYLFGWTLLMLRTDLNGSLKGGITNFGFDSISVINGAHKPDLAIRRTHIIVGAQTRIHKTIRRERICR